MKDIFVRLKYFLINRYLLKGGEEMVRSIEYEDATLKKILEKRRSVRTFTDEIPDKSDIEKVVYAGILAPFAAAAVGDSGDFRKFVVVKGTSPKLKVISELFKKGATNMLGEMRAGFAGKSLPPFAIRLEITAANGLPGLGKAPYYIIAFEQKGIPPAERQSLAHVMENMWLRATSLALGFWLISMFDRMAGEKEFFDALGMEPNRYAVSGCAIGVPEKSPGPNKYSLLKDLSGFIKWAD
jgi:nitroreductase